MICLCERLSPRIDRLARPLLGVFRNRRVFDRPEDDLFALDVVAGEREPPDPERDDSDAEEDQHAS
jgi:hypothetical protein